MGRSPLSLVVLFILVIGANGQKLTLKGAIAEHPPALPKKNHWKPAFHWNGDSWWSRDKFQHFLGSMMSTTFVALWLQRQQHMARQNSKEWGVAFTITLGIGKEVKDHFTPGNHFCWKDLCWDIGGIITGIILLNQ